VSNIKVNDLAKLNLSGTELFDDSESFLTELNDENEQMGVVGGSCILSLFRENPIVDYLTERFK
jgi:dihydrofolate reductase